MVMSNPANAPPGNPNHAQDIRSTYWTSLKSGILVAAA
jgi:hypothetical protein